jgi:opacity protein-like surface antigen
MKGLLWGLTVMVAVPFSAAAQDVNWTGFYGGANLTQSSGMVDWIDNGGGWFTFLPGAAYSSEGSATGGGIQLGYQRQWDNNFVAGVELGIGNLGVGENITSPFFPVSDVLGTEINSVVTLTSRIGYASGRWLPYLEAGIAAGDVGVTNVDSFFCGPPCVFSSDEWQVGYVVGLGVEYRISDRSSLGLSYRHMDFGSETRTGTTTGVLVPESYTVSAQADVFSLRWNWYFN